MRLQLLFTVVLLSIVSISACDPLPYQYIYLGSLQPTENPDMFRVDVYPPDEGFKSEKEFTKKLINVSSGDVYDDLSLYDTREVDIPTVISDNPLLSVTLYNGTVYWDVPCLKIPRLHNFESPLIY